MVQNQTKQGKPRWHNVIVILLVIAAAAISVVVLLLRVAALQGC